MHSRSTGALALALASLAPTALGQWTETQAPAAGLAEDDFYGTAVAVTGDLAFVGAPGFGTPGQAVHVLQRDAGGPGAWGEITRLTTGLPNTPTGLGNSVAVSNNWVLVGASGHLKSYLFHRHAGGDDAWGEFTSFDQPPSGERFGHAVAIDGDTLVIGDPLDVLGGGVPGAAFVYQQHQGGTNNWGLVTRLDPSDANPWGNFGRSLAIDGDTIVVSALNFGEFPVRGAVYVFERDLGGANAWGERIKLSPGPFGRDYGYSVALRGDRLVVGDRSDQEQGGSSGAVSVLERDLGGPNNWGTRKKLEPEGHTVSITFGSAVAISEDGNRIVAGAQFDDFVASNAGSASVFDRNQGGLDAWGSVQRLTASNALQTDLFGTAVAVSGSTVLVGANQGFGTGTGRAYLYVEDSPPEAYCTSGTSASGCTAALSASGTASASAPTGFFLTALGVEGDKDGLFFSGTNGRQANAWGSGSSLQCVVPPVQRAGILAGTGTAGACDGAFSQDLNARWALKPGQNPGAGATVQAQLWYRDPANTSNQTTSLSNAIEFVVNP